MERIPRWLMLALAVTLTGALFARAAGATGPSTPAPAAQVARDGLELGLLASIGAIATPTASPTPTDTPAPTEEPTATPQPTTTPAPPPTPVPKGKLIFIDPGHGGADSGAPHYGAGGAPDLLEKDVNLGEALRLADLLRADGYDVLLSRDTDRFILQGGSTPDELQARVDKANQAGAALYICMHSNGSENGSQRGTEVYYCSARSFSDQNIRLARLVQEALLRNMRQAGYDAFDRGVKDDSIEGHLAVLAPYNLVRATKMPGILGEALFMSNDADAAALARPEIRQAIAQGYFEAIKAFFGDN